MFVTNRQWTDFVVKGSLGNEVYMERVCFLADHWEEVLPKLSSFFDRHILPEVSYPRVKYGLPRFDLRGM